MRIDHEAGQDDVFTSLVLLSDSGGRSRRDVNSSEEGGRDPPDLSRGYSQSGEDFLKGVDISEDKIKSSVQEKNLSLSSENVSIYI